MRLASHQRTQLKPKGAKRKLKKTGFPARTKYQKSCIEIFLFPSFDPMDPLYIASNCHLINPKFAAKMVLRYA
jgi:hypothetical protein